jgi:SulP family sulfate permease
MEDRLLEAAGWRAPSEETLLGLGGIELFADLDADSLRELATAVSARSLAAGEKVCSRGDTGDELFLIQRGRVQVLLPLEGGKVHHLATLGQGDYFGDLAFLDREPRTADVVAAVQTDLYVLSRERFDELVRRNPAMGGRVFEQLAYAISKRLRATDIELQALEAR